MTPRKTSLFLILIFSSFWAFAQYDSLDINGMDRTFLTHLPVDYNPNNKLPLVVAMHGGTGNAYNLENQSGLSLKSDESNFIVVYPEGVVSNLLGIRTWNAGWCCGFASINNIDDVQFISDLIDHFVENYNVDPLRIYLTGMSNGGYMSYRLACELRNKIAAIAPVSAAMSMVDCSPQNPMPIIHFHSYLDENVRYEGGMGIGISNHHSPPLDSIFQAWANHNQCQILADTLLSTDQYDLIEWSNCECDATIRYYITRDGGHSWHGGNGTLLGDDPSLFINANDLMWDFFKEHRLDCDVSNLITTTVQEPQCYPNPASDYLEFTLDESPTNIKIEIYNQAGVKVKEKSNLSRINIKNLSPGIHFIKLKIKGKVQVLKFIKI